MVVKFLKLKKKQGGRDPFNFVSSDWFSRLSSYDDDEFQEVINMYEVDKIHDK
jgi:hypothetical protein